MREPIGTESEGKEREPEGPAKESASTGQADRRQIESEAKNESQIIGTIPGGDAAEPIPLSALPDSIADLLRNVNTYGSGRRRRPVDEEKRESKIRRMLFRTHAGATSGPQTRGRPRNKGAGTAIERQMTVRLSSC